MADHLPEKLRTVVTARMRRAYHAESTLAAQCHLPIEHIVDRHHRRHG